MVRPICKWTFLKMDSRLRGNDKTSTDPSNTPEKIEKNSSDLFSTSIVVLPFIKKRNSEIKKW